MSVTDPYTIEIIRSSLEAIGDEMFSALQRTSMSPIIYETLDYSVGVTDACGDLITQGNGTTVFLAMIDSLVRDILAKFGSKGDIHPGDVFMSNDPYEGGGTHLSDFGLVAPVFHQNELVAFVVNKAHWVDVGGKNPGSFSTNATEIFQEGIQIPSVKIISRGQVNEAILEIVAANIRLPKDSMGDFWAGVAANRVGERRIVDLFEKYGREAVLEAKDQLLAYGETMIKKDLVPAGAQSDTGANFFAAFAAGNIGISPSGAFAIGALNTQYPDIDYGITFLPGKDGGWSSFAGGDNFVVTKGTKKIAVVKEFLDFAYSLEGQTILAKYGSLPVRGDIAKDALKDLDPRYQIAAEAMAKGRTPYSVVFNDLINSANGPWTQMINEVFFGDDVDGAIANAQETMQSIIDQAPQK